MRRLPDGTWINPADEPQPLATDDRELAALQRPDRGQRPRGLHLVPSNPDAVRDALRENA